MKRNVKRNSNNLIKFIPIVLAATLTCCKLSQKPNYPIIEPQQINDNYFGVTVQDPFRVLETDSAKITIDWKNEEAKLTDEYFKNIPFKNEIEQRIAKISNRSNYGFPFKKQGIYYFYYQDSIYKTRVFCRARNPFGKPEVLVNPNNFSTGTQIYDGIRFSQDGKYLSYQTSIGGSDWTKIFVLDLKTKQLLPDSLFHVKYSDVSWAGHGFYYCRYDINDVDLRTSSVLKYHKVYYHEIGNPQKNDKLVMQNKTDPMVSYFTQTFDDEKYLFVYEEKDNVGTSLYFKDLQIKDAPFVRIVGNYQYYFHISGVLNGKIIAQTNFNAPFNKLIAIDPQNPGESNWTTLIGEKGILLRSAMLAAGKIFVLYMENACARLFIYNPDGTFLKEVNLPTKGWVEAIESKYDDSEILLLFSSFAYPWITYNYDISKNKLEVVSGDLTYSFNPDQYVTDQVFIKSKDSTQVPMFITHKKGISFNSKNPTYIYAYGGFNQNETPKFDPTLIPFLENGGIYVVCNLRGGGEFGKEWHEAGTRMKKKNSFDDFISATEWLIKNKYTNPQKIAISGRSNGGLLIGSVMTQRPELFKVAIPEFGVLDMLRYQKFTIGQSWAGDYGTSEESKEMFEYLYSYSPYHNIKVGTKYPVTLVVTGDYDDRVVPAHSYKFTAQLQHAADGRNPIFLYILHNKGHDSYIPPSDRWAFVMKYLGMKPKFD
jgi:prolyl oligopeptidase